MRQLIMILAAAATLSVVALLPTAAEAGCYRLGLTGYHWYHFCLGPGVLYPHQRVCRNGYCWYR
jgi:hypothetical protein